MIERDGNPQAFHVLAIRGTGMLALSVATRLLVLTVEGQDPINVSIWNLIS